MELKNPAVAGFFSSHTVQIKRIAVIGGGTAGWLAANHLASALSTEKNISLTLIESPDIPIIGVGEGTVPAMRRTLKGFGISETHFFRKCDASFKQSIKFVNWLDRKKHGNNNHYHHVFDYPFPFGDDLTPYWLTQKPQFRFVDAVSVQGRICDAYLAPKKITTPEYEGDATYAYHLNAAKFAQMLCKHAVQQFSVEHIKANVIEVQIAENGFIEALLTDTQGWRAFDFYIDCTGFSSYLLGEKLCVPFVDKSNQLLIDSALVRQVPTLPDSEIPPYTVATAHQAGWIWDIALPARRGVGFVYSSRHMDLHEAQRKFAHYLGLCEDEAFRRIPMQVGYRAQFWEKNCVAIGLSQGFIEPLEATAILLADYSAKMLANKFPRCQTDIELLQRRYNRNLRYSWERVFDFIKMHYFISDRSDSEFWLDNRNPESLSDTLADLLQLWRYSFPKVEDFFSKFEVFDVENYLYVLYGMRYPTQITQPTSAYIASAQLQCEAVQRQAEKMLQSLPKHREYLKIIQTHEMQKV